MDTANKHSQYMLHGKPLQMNDKIWDAVNRLYFVINEEWAISAVSTDPSRFYWSENDVLAKEG